MSWRPSAGVACIAELSALLNQRRLIIKIGLTLPLQDIVAAHVSFENGSIIGNVVLTLLGSARTQRGCSQKIEIHMSATIREVIIR
jgi:hypothetical protein